ncbi:MAG: site-specific integrase [Lachnospiraceae bacterium]|nr:site-specific integrase [Ruminococcus sp.]MCM1276727.1 site-specific integrase [Lachnospiraceae bacterium]
MRIDKITARQIQTFLNSMAKDGANMLTGKPLSPKTIQHHLELISGVFNYALKMELISDNPCSKVTIPKGEVKEKQIYSQEEMVQLLTKMDGEPLKYKAFFYLMAYSGFRHGEMLGLEWKDIDFENAIISVRRTSNQTADRGVYTDTTKTRRSQRTLKISPYIMGMLKALKTEQNEEALKLGDYWVDTDRLFTKDNGEPQHPNTTYEWLRRFCKREELPFHGIHSFHHSHASLLANANISIQEISRRLGHSNVELTVNIPKGHTTQSSPFDK